MKILDIFLSSLFLCITSLPLILLILMLQRDPAVPPNPPLDQAQVAEIQQLLIDHDPRLLLASNIQEVRLSENELNALITYVKNSNPVLESINGRTTLRENGASIAFSIPLRAAGMLRYINLSLHFGHVDDRLELTSVDVGALTIPSVLLGPLRQSVGRQMGQDENFQLAASFIDSLHFQSITPERVVIMLDWQGENLEQLESQARQVFVSTRDAERLAYYHDKLVGAVAALPSSVRTVRLNDLLRPLFLFASFRTAGGADPATENQAVFIVLSSYVTDFDLAQLIGDEIELESPRPLNVVIESREDLARHVVSSAAITASAGAAMAEVLSVYKEVHDARYRTGFSFSDIAANQTGSLLGTLATRSTADAMLFQDLMKGILSETDYMPLVGTYDGMTEEQFISTYGSRESEAYQQRLQEIRDSILARPFYQSFAN